MKLDGYAAGLSELTGGEKMCYPTAMKTIRTARVARILTWLNHRNHLIKAGIPAA
jgi:hypothetical protein